MRSFPIRGAIAPLILCLAACGGGGGGGGGGGNDRAGPSIGSVPASVTGREAELPLSDPDLVLLAALGAVAMSVQFDSNDFRDLVTDIGGPDAAACDAGTLSVQSTGSSSSGPFFSIDADHCYSADADGESLRNGHLDVGPATSPFEQAVFGTSTRAFVAASRDVPDSTWAFQQRSGTLRIDNPDRTARVSESAHFRAVVGTAHSADTVRPADYLELFAYSVDSPFNASVDSDGATRVVGRLAIRGVGLDGPCGSTGSFFVSTPTPLSVQTDEKPFRITGGTLSFNAGDTIVVFDATGGAQVTTASGTTDYTADEVQSHCGLDV